ncbi:DUF3000 domain-containing protein [Angustibacter sp. Root456]|uniref:DUF3000 domain-containing protein n=1 Tax=Angustibacter sp. Root456 TaxID=1736539 RepID=UPI0006F28B55|nr:DUF3000 domain-containing protein [Angustibacter sp. Root456]KQX66781.1 enoyl-CoA hydratase [Angustibacter sp. Root456]
MVARTLPDDAPEPFQAALRALKSAVLRPEIVLTEAPSPGRIAPYSVALTADVVDRRGAGEAEELATGRFVLLYDPSSPEPWDGTFRAVTFVRADLEPELGSDPLLGEVGWSWLLEALDQRGAAYRNEGGTVTRVVSESFAALADRPSGVEIEIRASWTPQDDDLAAHLSAWTDLLCTVAGLPPLPEGVTALPARRR